MGSICLKEPWTYLKAKRKYFDNTQNPTQKEFSVDLHLPTMLCVMPYRNGAHSAGTV